MKILSKYLISLIPFVPIIAYILYIEIVFAQPNDTCRYPRTGYEEIKPILYFIRMYVYPIIIIIGTGISIFIYYLRKH